MDISLARFGCVNVQQIEIPSIKDFSAHMNNCNSVGVISRVKLNLRWHVVRM